MIENLNCFPFPSLYLKFNSIFLDLKRSISPPMARTYPKNSEDIELSGVWFGLVCFWVKIIIFLMSFLCSISSIHIFGIIAINFLCFYRVSIITLWLFVGSEIHFAVGLMNFPMIILTFRWE